MTPQVSLSLEWSIPFVMSSVKLECVVKSNALIGEGPVWEETEQTLLFVDIVGQKILRWNSLTNYMQSVDTGQIIRRQIVHLQPVRTLRVSLCVCGFR